MSSPDSPGAVYSTLEMSVQLTKLGSQVRCARSAALPRVLCYVPFFLNLY